MKYSKLLLAGILGILTAATVRAQTTVYITGAPAVRSYVSQAIEDVLTSSTTGSITYAFSGSGVTVGTAFASSNALIYYGGNVTVNGSAVPITVSVSYVGSSSGIQDVASSGSANFLNIGDTQGGSPYSDPTSTGAQQQDEEFPLFTASDEFQQSTPWFGTNTLTGATPVTYQGLHSDIAGIIPYRFVASPDAPARLTNITIQQAREVWENGYVWLSSLTGSTSANSGGAYPDDTEAVYALGRNPGSGLRTILLSETGIGVQTNVKQFEPTLTATNGLEVATSQVLYPGGTVNGVGLGAGDNGYSSFGNLDPAISAHTIGTWDGVNASIVGNGLTNDPAIGAANGIYITALADADALTAEAAGAHELSYNGFYEAGSPGATLPPNGGASTTLANGQYTFWSYIQLQYQPGLATASLSEGTTAQQQIAYAFEQALWQELKTKDAAVLLQNVNVSRAQDGGAVTKGNPY